MITNVKTSLSTMKTTKFCLLLAFLASPIFIFSNFRPHKEPPVLTTVRGDAALNRLRVVVTKPLNVPVTLRVLDQDGWPIHEEPVAARSTTVRANLNLCAVPNGTYRIEISDRNRVQAHLIQLSPSTHPAMKRQIDVWTVQ